MAATAARRWTPFEISVLDKRTIEKVDPSLIAAELGRTISSVVNRVQRPNKRRFDIASRAALPTYVQEDTQYVVPPPYVRRERDIRLSIPAVTVTQVIFCDPVEGYSALASRSRRISVQDALEICAIYTGLPGDISRLSHEYKVSTTTIRLIIDGSFFERLLPHRDRRNEAEEL